MIRLHNKSHACLLANYKICYTLYNSYLYNLVTWASLRNVEMTCEGERKWSTLQHIISIHTRVAFQWSLQQGCWQEHFQVIVIQKLPYQFHIPLCEWVCLSINAVSFKSEYFLRTASCPAVRSQIFGDLNCEDKEELHQTRLWPAIFLMDMLAKPAQQSYQLSCNSYISDSHGTLSLMTHASNSG